MQTSVYEQIASQGKVDEAINKCLLDIASFEKSGSNSEYADALHAVAAMLKFYKSAYRKALEYLAIEIQVRALHGLPGIDSAYLKCAVLNAYLDKKKLVIKYAGLTLQNTRDSGIKGIALNVLGDAIFETDPDGSGKHYKEAEQLLIEQADDYNLAHVRLSIARLEGFAGNIDVALNICRQEISKGNGPQNPGILGTAYLRFAEIYAYNQEFDKSRSFARKAHFIGVENHWTVLASEAQKLMTTPPETATG